MLQVLVSPNKAVAPDSFALRITKNGQPVRGANVTLTFNHTEMQMPQQEYQLTETQPGVYSRAAPALVMVGKWALGLPDRPQGRPAVHRADPRPGQRMTEPRLNTVAVRLRLLAAVVALTAGVAAILIAILLLKGALSSPQHRVAGGTSAQPIYYSKATNLDERLPQQRGTFRLPRRWTAARGHLT